MCVKCKQWRIYWVNQCNMPSDSHNILQIHHRLYYINEQTLPRTLPLRSLPLLVAFGWVNFFLFTSGSHLCNCVYRACCYDSYACMEPVERRGSYAGNSTCHTSAGQCPAIRGKDCASLLLKTTGITASLACTFARHVAHRTGLGYGWSATYSSGSSSTYA